MIADILSPDVVKIVMEFTRGELAETKQQILAVQMGEMHFDDADQLHDLFDSLLEVM